MDVMEALAGRFSCRDYLDTPVPRELVEAILEGASRAPSGGNLQPWRIWALTGEPLRALEAAVLDRVAAGALSDGEPEYFIYPPHMGEPFAERRFRSGEAYYNSIEVTRDDAMARFREFRRNFEFFGAPVGLIVAVDRSLQQGQWSDVGMYLQSLMLLARANGLHTVALESWSLFHRTVREALGVPDELIIFCGVALGHGRMDSPFNQYRSTRVPLAEFAVLDGFDSQARSSL